MIKALADIAKLELTSAPLYIPLGTVKSRVGKMMIAAIGRPGSGKTTGAATFPNPIFADFDNKLPANYNSIPFWNAAFCDAQFGPNQNGRTNPAYPNRRDAFQRWLAANLSKFTPEQTFVVDSWTMVMNAFDVQTRLDEPRMGLTSKGEVNKFWFWGEKLNYARNIHEILRSAACNIIVTVHESPDRDEKGELNGKINPLMDGSFKDQMLGHYTDAWHFVRNPIEFEANGTSKKIRTANDADTFYWNFFGDPLVDTNCNPDLGKILRAKKINRLGPNPSYDALMKMISV